MNTHSVYRESAADTLQLAQRATNASDKNRLLSLAEKWLALADRAATTNEAVAANPAYPLSAVRSDVPAR